MASVNEIIERWDRAHNLGTQWVAKRYEVQRLIETFKEMRELLRYVADQEMGVHGQIIDKLIDDSAKLLAKLDAEE